MKKNIFFLNIFYLYLFYITKFIFIYYIYLRIFLLKILKIKKECYNLLACLNLYSQHINNIHFREFFLLQGEISVYYT